MTVQGVAGEKGGLGYFGLSYYEQNKDTLKAVQIDGGKGCVEPSTATVQDKSYTPLSRPLFVYVKDESLKRPEVQAFVKYYTDNAASLAQTALFVPLTPKRSRPSRAISPLDWPRSELSSPRGCDDALGKAQPASRRLGTARRHWGEDLGKVVLFLCACLSIATTVGIVIALLAPALEFFGSIPVTDFYTGTKWRRCSSRRTSVSCRWCWARSRSRPSPVSSACRSASVPPSTWPSMRGRESAPCSSRASRSSPASRRSSSDTSP